MSALSDAYVLPASINRLFSRVPAFPGSLVFSLWLNKTFNDLLPADVLSALQGKNIAIVVQDAGIRVAFRREGQHFRASRPGQDCDLSFSASAHDFFLLATRKEDPDTLFFSRRLLIEGDTQLGLLLKNTLDALEWSVLDTHLPLLPKLPMLPLPATRLGPLARLAELLRKA